MQTDSNNYVLKDEFTDGGFYKVKEAINMLTHSQEKSLVDISYKKYKELRKIISKMDWLQINILIKKKGDFLSFLYTKIL